MPHGAIPFPFGCCKICGDNATGIHYGVATCEGCKGFFKRSIPKADKYKCFFGNNCVVSPQNRNRCKSCRFKKCLNNGMSVDAVKMGRIPKLEKDKALKEVFGSGIEELEQAKKTGQSESENCDVPFSDCASTCLQNSFCESEKIVSQNISPSAIDNGFSTQMDHDFENAKSSTVTGNKNWVNEQMVTNCVKFKSGCMITDEKKNEVEKNLGALQKSFYSPELIKVLLDQLLGSNSNASQRLLQRLQNRQNDSPNGEVKKSAECIVQEIISSYGEADVKNKICSQMNYRDSDEKDLIYQLCAMLDETQNQQKTEILHNTGSHPLMFSRLLDNGVNASKSDILLKDGSRSLASIPQNGTLYPLKSNTSPNCTYYDYNTRNSTAENDICNLTSRTVEYQSSNNTPFSSTTQYRLPYDRTTSQTSESYNESMPASLSSSSDVSSSYLSDFSRSPEMNVDVSKNDVQNLECYPSACSLPQETLTHAYIDDLEHSSPVFSPQSPEAALQQNPFFDTRESTSYFATNNTSFYPETSFLDSQNNHPLSNGSGFSSFPHTDYKQNTEAYLEISGRFNSSPLQTVPQKVNPKQFFGEEEGQSNTQLNGVNSEGWSDSVFDDADSIMEASPGIMAINLYFDEVKQCLQRLLSEHDLLNETSWKEAKIAQAQKLNHKFEKTDSSMKEVWNQLMLSIPNCNKRVIGFSKSLPGLEKLSEEDQEILLKRAYYDVWMISASRFFFNGECYLVFPNKTFYCYAMMKHILSEDLIKLMFTFTDQLNGCKLTDLQLSILCAIRVFTASDKVDLIKNDALLKEINSFYLDLLANVIADERPNSGRVLIDVFRILPQLDDINKAQQRTVANFNVSSPPDSSGCCLDK